MSSNGRNDVLRMIVAKEFERALEMLLSRAKVEHGTSCQYSQTTWQVEIRKIVA
jgi:hypothetical protein